MAIKIVLLYITKVDWRDHMMMSYLLLMTFLTNLSTATPTEDVCGLQGRLLKNKSYLVTFHESILISLGAFLLTLIFQIVLHHYNPFTIFIKYYLICKAK